MYSPQEFWIQGILSTLAFPCADPRNLAESPLDRLWVKVTDHMQHLGESPGGFSEDPLYITVSTPTALDVVVYDLPGPGHLPPEPTPLFENYFFWEDDRGFWPSQSFGCVHNIRMWCAYHNTSNATPIFLMLQFLYLVTSWILGWKTPPHLHHITHAVDRPPRAGAESGREFVEIHYCASSQVGTQARRATRGEPGNLPYVPVCFGEAQRDAHHRYQLRGSASQGRLTLN